MLRRHVRCRQPKSFRVARTPREHRLSELRSAKRAARGFIGGVLQLRFFLSALFSPSSDDSVSARMQSTTPTLVGQDEEDSQRRLSMKSLSGPPSPTNSTGKDVEKGESSQYYAGNVVKFDEGDPEDPLNFSAVRKWLIVANVGMTTFGTSRRSAPAVSRLLTLPRIAGSAIAFGSSIYTGGFAPMREYFQCSSLTLTLGLSLYVRSTFPFFTRNRSLCPPEIRNQCHSVPSLLAKLTSRFA